MKPPLRLQPWQWGLRARLGVALTLFRGDAAALGATVENIVQSHRVQTSDLAGARAGRDRFEVLSMAADKIREMPGLAMEFGVFQGITLRHIAHAIGPDRHAVGFDTFEGLPENWAELPKGTFKTQMPSFDGVPNVSLEVGRIESTLPAFLAKAPREIALVHIDCPYYAINIVILEAVLPFMADGSVVVFDEYYGYASYEEHEFRAWKEIRERFGITAVPFGYSSRSAGFQVTRNPRHSR